MEKKTVFKYFTIVNHEKEEAYLPVSYTHLDVYKRQGKPGSNYEITGK